MKKFIVLVFILFSLGYSQLKIYVVDNTEDRVGSSLLYKFKEQIRFSSSYQIAYSEKDIICKIIFGSIEKDQYGTVYSITWLVPNFYQLMYQGAIGANDSDISCDLFADYTFGYCGSIHLDEVASKLMAQTDKNITRMLELMKTIQEILKDMK